jgi:hypothetical protein
MCVIFYPTIEGALYWKFLYTYNPNNSSKTFFLFIVLGIQSRALSMLGKQSITELHLQPHLRLS